VALDGIDFEHRPWVSDADWPLEEAELRAWYPQAARILGLSRPELLFADRWASHPVARLGASSQLAVRIHRWGEHIDLGRAWRKPLAAAGGVQVLLRATAVDLQAAADGGRIERLACRSLSGRAFDVRARVFVLACGGFENPRLLLLSRQGVSPPALNWQPVGRYYMNHPRSEGVARLRLDPSAPALREWARRLVMHRDRQADGRLQFSFSPSDRLQREERLLNPTSFFFAVSDARARAARDAAREAAQMWAGNRLLGLGHAARLLPKASVLAAGAWHRLRMRPYRPEELVTVDQCEQPPDAASRISLGRGRDRFGCPMLELDWRIDPATTASLRRLHGLLAGLFDQLNIGRFESRLLSEPDYEPSYTDCAHPTGATRMSRSGRDGVVDPDCRVHGSRNLFVVGSSVFPVGGQANPTLAIIALAARLASRLKQDWSGFAA
jgi:choline dehydrogenase-like flavoprotein